MLKLYRERDFVLKHWEIYNRMQCVSCFIIDHHKFTGSVCLYESLFDDTL